MRETGKLAVGFYPIGRDQRHFDFDRSAGTLQRTPVKEIHYLQFLATVEEIFRDVIRRCYPTSWDEDHITYSITDELATKLPSVRVIGFDRPFNIRWDARKLRGGAEQALGDLAVVVRMTSWSGEQINGVGLLEAKRRYVDQATFSAFGKQQLRRIVRNAPSSRLLLYDYSQIADFEDNLHVPYVWPSDDPLRWPYHPYSVTPYSHSVTVPSALVLATGLNSTALYKYSIPFSVQLCSRYLRGFDLEFKDDAVSKVERFINRTGGPRTLLLVGVSTTDAEPVLPDWVSDNLYGPIRG